MRSEDLEVRRGITMYYWMWRMQVDDMTGDLILLFRRRGKGGGVWPVLCFSSTKFGFQIFFIHQRVKFVSMQN